MRKRVLLFFLLLVFAAGSVPAAYATIPTFDAINAALQGLQNSILNNSFIQDIALAVKRLEQLENQTSEMLRVHSGLDEILNFVKKDYVQEFINSLKPKILNAYSDAIFTMPQIEVLQTGGSPEDFRASLETVTGAIPEGNQRAYIPFEEMQVTEAFQLAGQIRSGGTDLRSEAQQIKTEAENASPKGAVRLGAQASAELMLLAQQTQEGLAKLLELEATQVEQVSRREKETEQARLRFTNDTNDYLDGILGVWGGGS